MWQPAPGMRTVIRIRTEEGTMDTRKPGLLLALALALASGASHAQSPLRVYSDNFGGPNQPAPAGATRDTRISMGVPRLHAVLARLRSVQRTLATHSIPPHGHGVHVHPPPEDPEDPLPALCADVAPAGYLGTVIPMQSVDPYASCFVRPGALCANVAPPGYAGTVIPMQSINPSAPCFLPPPPLCANVAPPGYLGTVIPMQSSNPVAPCFVPPLCEDVAPAGYLGTVIPMQSVDPYASCFVRPGALCADVAPAGYVGVVIPMQSVNPSAACFVPPPSLCADVAPPGYVGTVIPMQWSNPSGACFVPPLCEDVAPAGYLGTILPMQSTDPDEICYLAPPLVPTQCPAFSTDPPPLYTFTTDVPGLLIHSIDTRPEAFSFYVRWPGHVGEVVRVGYEYRDAYGRHSMVSRVHVMGTDGWHWRHSVHYSVLDWFHSGWLSGGYAQHYALWVSTNEGVGCTYLVDPEFDYGAVVEPLDLIPGVTYVPLPPPTCEQLQGGCP